MTWRPPFQPILAKNAVHIWRIDLNLTLQSIAALKELLSPQESTRAGRFRFEWDRRRFVVSHGALRAILSRYLDCAPELVQYRVTAKGKPFLAPPTKLYFNLAHSHELALAAITAIGEIGVDIEHIRPLEDIDRLARQCCAQQEYDQFSALAPPDSQHAFFNCWTRKEAYIKAVGDGLSCSLDHFVVSLLPTEPARLVTIYGDPGEANQWTLEALQPGEEYAAAFAVRTTNVVVQCLDWTQNAE